MEPLSGIKLTLRSTTSLLRSDVAVLVLPLTLSKLALNSLKARADTQIRHQPHCFQPRATRSITRPSSTGRHRYDHAQAVPLPVSNLSLAYYRIQLIIRYQGHVGAHLVLGGVDSTGPHLFTVAAHGSTDKLPYVTMGSGSLAAMAVFESSFKEHMTVSSFKRRTCIKLTISEPRLLLLSPELSDPVSSTIWVPVPTSMSLSSPRPVPRC
jgi:hypothetical protein